MSKKFKSCIFLMLGVLIFIIVLAGCEQLPDSTVKVGKLYTLQEALEFSLLTLDDIGQIANYYNNKLQPEKQLDENVALKIRNTQSIELKSRVDITGQSIYPNLSIDDVSLEYYGEYNDCYAVLITVRGFDYMDVEKPHNFGDGITINYSDSNFIKVWTDRDVKPGKFYDLHEAAELSLLTKEDIIQIANYQNYGLQPEKPLDEAVALKIKETRAAEWRAEFDFYGTYPYPNASADDVEITEYCGEYNGCYVIMLDDAFSTYHCAVWTDIVVDVRILYGNGNCLIVWVKG